MAKITALTNTNTRDVDVIANTAGTSYYKEAIVGRTGALDHPIAAQRVGTHPDDAAFSVATDAIVAIAGLADETAPDSVDEGDVGALRMTLDRRLITAGNRLDDAAFTPATSYVSPIAGLADDTAPDSVDEGDVGAVRMSLARALHVANVADAAAVTAVASAATSTSLLAANANRIGVIITNDDANILYVKFGATASLTDYTVQVPITSGVYVMTGPCYRGAIDGIWAADGAGQANITELT